MGHFIISADLGQTNDYSAFTIIDRVDGGCHLRHVERPELGTPYPRIVERLKELAASPEVGGARRTMVIDTTGCGKPVWDMLARAGISATLKGITITGGNTVHRDGSMYNVPKRDLVAALQVAFQNGELKIARGLPLADTLVTELMHFKVKININGHDQYEAWREGVHDDIVLSAAMGVWVASQDRWLENYKNLIS